MFVTDFLNWRFCLRTMKICYYAMWTNCLGSSVLISPHMKDGNFHSHLWVTVFNQVKLLYSYKLWKYLFSVNQVELVQRVKKTPSLTSTVQMSDYFWQFLLVRGLNCQLKKRDYISFQKKKNAPFLLTPWSMFNQPMVNGSPPVLSNKQTQLGK